MSEIIGCVIAVIAVAGLWIFIGVTMWRGDPKSRREHEENIRNIESWYQECQKGIDAGVPAKIVMQLVGPPRIVGLPIDLCDTRNEEIEVLRRRVSLLAAVHLTEREMSRVLMPPTDWTETEKDQMCIVWNSLSGGGGRVLKDHEDKILGYLPAEREHGEPVTSPPSPQTS